MQQTIGHLFLNCSFVLYLILYLPQLYYNAKEQKFSHMSVTMHFMLLQAYGCDLSYGIGRGMPWQYITVSVVGLFYLLVQHGQWFFYNLRHHKKYNLSFLLFGLILCFWPLMFRQASHVHFQAWLSRLLFVAHFIPQIIKYNRHPNERDAVSLTYLTLSVTLSTCDLISAYCLKWDLANQTGSLISLGLKAYLYMQILKAYKFKPKLSFLKTLSAR